MLNSLNLGKLIKDKLVERQMSQKQLAKLIGISDNAMSQIIIGETFPHYGNINKICDILNVELEFKDKKHQYKLGDVVTVDFVTNHPNGNSHVQALSKIHRIVVGIYNNGTLLLANLYDNEIEKTSKNKYKVSCCINTNYYSDLIHLVTSGLGVEPIENIIPDNYYIAVEKMFGH
jgi:DNA-binding Xre family transcriptional regulator